MNTFLQSKRWQKLRVWIHVRFISEIFITSCFYFHIWREPNTLGLDCLPAWLLLCWKGELKGLNPSYFNLRPLCLALLPCTTALGSVIHHTYVKPWSGVSKCTDQRLHLVWPFGLIFWSVDRECGYLLHSAAVFMTQSCAESWVLHCFCTSFA